MRSTYIIQLTHSCQGKRKREKLPYSEYNTHIHRAIYGVLLPLLYSGSLASYSKYCLHKLRFDSIRF